MTVPLASGPGLPRNRRRRERREQLLDTAADLVVERGLAGFSMEALAAAAGVSKALPYRHFANAQDVLIELYRRETRRLAIEVLTAAEERKGDDVLRAAVGAYFDIVEERGALLNVLAGAGSPIPDLAGGGARPAPTFVADLVTRACGLTGREAMVLASIVTGAVTAASDSLGRGDAPRATVERVTTTAVVGAVRAAARGRPR